jgi:hypothetical protein
LSILAVGLALSLGLGTVAGADLTEADKAEIERIAEELPIILAERGWEPYEEYFHPDYVNWSMVRDQTRSREEFLAAVKAWYDDGNRASGSEVEPIAFVELVPGVAMFLHSQQEQFNKGAEVREIRFVSIYKQEEGRWYLLATSFMDLPEE